MKQLLNPYWKYHETGRAAIAWGIAATVLGAILWIVPVLAQTEIWTPADTDSYTVLRSQRLFDAEQETITGEYWAFDADAHSGEKAARGLPTQWVRPKVRFARTDISWADELWLWVKLPADGQVTIQLGSWKGLTSGYTQTVPSGWTLVRIPLFGIDAGNEAFEVIEDLYFNAAGTIQLLIDDVWAVKLGPPATEPLPQPEPTPEPEPEPEPTPEPTPVITWGPWTFAGFEILQTRTASDGTTQRRTVPIVVSIGLPEVQP